MTTVKVTCANYGVKTLDKSELEVLMIKMKQWDTISFDKNGVTHQFVKLKSSSKEVEDE